MAEETCVVYAFLYLKLELVCVHNCWRISFVGNFGTKENKNMKQMRITEEFVIVEFNLMTIDHSSRTCGAVQLLLFLNSNMDQYKWKCESGKCIDQIK